MIYLVGYIVFAIIVIIYCFSDDMYELSLKYDIIPSEYVRRSLICSLELGILWIISIPLSLIILISLIIASYRKR